MNTRSAKTKLTLNIISFVLHILLNVLFYTVVVLIVMTLSKEAYQFTYQIFGNVVVDEAPGRDVEIEIKKGDRTKDIAAKLELNRVIVDKNTFYIRAKLSKTNIMPGTYVVNTSMNYREILQVISDLSNNEDKEP